MALSRSDRSPFVQTTKGTKVDIRLDRKMPYELDGGDRKPTQAAEGAGRAGARSPICVPEEEPS